MANRSTQLSLGFSNLGHYCTHVVMLLYPTVVVVLERETGAGYASLLALSYAGFVMFGLGALPAGLLADRWSPLAMMTIFFIGTGVACVLTGLARNPLEIGSGLALIGLFASIYHPVGTAWLVRNARNRGRALGLNGVFGSLGTASAALIAGVLSDLLSWRAAFIVPGMACLLAGAAFALLVRWRWIVLPPADVRPQAAETRDTMLRAFLVLSVTMLCSGLLYQANTVAMPKLFSERLGAVVGDGAMGVGGLVSLVYLSGAGAHLLGGWMADRFPLRLVYALGFMVQTPALLLATSAQSYPLVAVAMAMVFLNVASLPAENALLARYSPSRWRSTAYGAKFILSLGVGAMAAPLAGLVHGATGSFAWLFVILAAIATTGTLAALTLPGARLRPATPLPQEAD